MVAARQREQFAQGAGTSALGPLTCQTCGFHSDNRKLFKKDGDGHTCSTGHFDNAEGQPQRAKNPYAR